MKAFNLYYKSRKINKIPMDIDTLRMVLKEKYIYKKTTIPGQIEKIPTDQIVAKQCILLL